MPRKAGGPAKVDDYTFTVDTVTPKFDFLYFLIVPEVNAIISKKNYETDGHEGAQFEGVGTGPWEFVDQSTREFWKFSARENHYRQDAGVRRADSLGTYLRKPPGSPTSRPANWTASSWASTPNPPWTRCRASNICRFPTAPRRT